MKLINQIKQKEIPVPIQRLDKVVKLDGDVSHSSGTWNSPREH